MNKVGRLGVAASVALLALACLPRDPEGLTTARLHTTRSVESVRQTVTLLLIREGFDITTERDGGVTGTREGAADDNFDYIACPFPKGRITVGNVAPGFVVVVRARPVKQGTDVSLGATVRMGFVEPEGRETMRSNPRSKECVSSGHLEKRIAASVQD